MTKIRTSHGFARFKNISLTPSEYASSLEIPTSRPWGAAELVIAIVAAVAAVALWVSV